MATYYINADTGNDTTGDGSQGNPWLTLSKAISSSASSDTIFCQNSTNTFLFANLNIGIRTIEGESTTGVVFTANGVDITTGWNCTSGTVVKNITFSNINTIGSYGRFIYGSLTLQNCIFTEISGNAAIGNVFGGNFIITLNNCLFYNIPNNVSHLLYRSSTSIFYVYNCVFDLSDHLNSTFRIFGGDGSNSPYSFYFKNNIVYSTSTNVFDVVNGSTTVDFQFNCTYGSYSDMPTGTGNLINTDPLFIDAANNNYNLSPSSPCIDAGTLI